MKTELLTMLELQNRMNTRVHPQWAAQKFEWYRAAWIECGELIEHYGYKWWKKQTPDLEQVQLEVIDIWHFGMSALISEEDSLEAVAERIIAELENYSYDGTGVREATESLALHCLQTHSFSPSLFWSLMNAAELNFESLYRSYVGKNVLNFFRQDNGYQDGTYHKNWSGREDNEHLVELVAELDSHGDDFPELLYASLKQRYTDSLS